MTDQTPRVIATLTAELGALHMAGVRGEITADSDLAADLGMNSIDLVCVTCALETEFGIDIGDAEAAAWERVADVVRSVERGRVGV